MKSFQLLYFYSIIERIVVITVDCCFKIDPRRNLIRLFMNEKNIVKKRSRFLRLESQKGGLPTQGGVIMMDQKSKLFRI